MADAFAVTRVPERDAAYARVKFLSWNRNSHKTVIYYIRYITFAQTGE
jgi:hypothetical protein